MGLKLGLKIHSGIHVVRKDRINCSTHLRNGRLEVSEGGLHLAARRALLAASRAGHSGAALDSAAALDSI